MVDSSSERQARLDLVRGLAVSLRRTVVPWLGRGREIGAAGVGGDVTFGIDEIAETALAERLEAWRASGGGWPIAYYSEDRGLVGATDARDVLVVDPIDGTRPAMAGLESACVAVALAPLGDGAPTMGDVGEACVVEIKTGGVFLAGAGLGVLEASVPIAVSRATEVETMFWAYGFRGRPARPTVEVLAELIDASSVRGGVFELGSQAFGMTRIATGQLDALVEVGSRMVDEVPGMREAFEAVGHGAILNNSPYDLAAPWLVLREAGGVITDGWGRTLEDRPLLGSGHAFQMSSISAANPALHGKLVAAVDAGISRLCS